MNKVIAFLSKYASIYCLHCARGRNQGGRTSSTNHVKKLHSIVRYAESSWGFTEIKQVSTRSIQVCQGSMGLNAWNTFVPRVEHSYIVRKSEKSLDMGELTFHAKETACCRLQQETKVHILALARQTSL